MGLVALMYEQDMMHHVLPANGEDDASSFETYMQSKDPGQVTLLPK